MTTRASDAYHCRLMHQKLFFGWDVPGGFSSSFLRVNWLLFYLALYVSLLLYICLFDMIVVCVCFLIITKKSFNVFFRWGLSGGDQDSLSLFRWWWWWCWFGGGGDGGQPTLVLLVIKKLHRLFYYFVFLLSEFGWACVCVCGVEDFTITLSAGQRQVPSIAPITEQGWSNTCVCGASTHWNITSINLIVQVNWAQLLIIGDEIWLALNGTTDLRASKNQSHWLTRLEGFFQLYTSSIESGGLFVTARHVAFYPFSAFLHTHRLGESVRINIQLLLVLLN